ncbi:archaeal/vacuolar-type H+-ATPase subunit E [Aciduliprofundum sp. MAR08-339]|uniref:V-type ATP synthase subunit E n=1 Tax=Aciduliprofundum sp. (strain MAR08-339) TaxID=673860 RepID=UPI0002A4BD03|nr:archaeal/vacuolar-type H+-ATPase subunit E [Aciduliprofundum sp. MAR08-339]
MDAIENIIKRIREDADWKIKEYYEKAEREIEKIKNAEQGKWEREKEKLESSGKREAETIKQMHISKAHLDGKKMLMNAREWIIHMIIEEMLMNFRDYVDYRKYIENSIKDAADLLGNRFEILCKKEDIGLIEGMVKDMGLQVNVQEGDVEYGGFLAVSTDGLKNVDYSARAFVDRNMGDIRKKIYLRLFGEEHA